MSLAERDTVVHCRDFNLTFLSSPGNPDRTLRFVS